MAGYRLRSASDGRARIESLDLLDQPWEQGPGEFKGMSGSVAGPASRLMLMRLVAGSRPPQHPAPRGLAVLLQGELVVTVDGAEVVLRPGDSIRLEAGDGAPWRIGNRGSEDAVIALVQMPPSSGQSGAG